MKHSNLSIFIPHAGCPNQCSFCDQKIISGKIKAPSPKEVEVFLQKNVPMLKNPKQTEIAFFGGSFTAIDRDYMISLLRVAAQFVADYDLMGIRVSTRPDAVDEEICSVLKTYGVTVVELGAQSMDDSVLIANERGHSVNDVIAACSLLRRNGFQLGLQMMTGLYKSSPEIDRKTAESFVTLQPDMVRIYPAITLKYTKLEQYYRSGGYLPQTLEEAVELCSALLVLFDDANIPVIRLGLHASEELKNGYVAGPYHPAFRELCESRLMYHKACEILKSVPKGNVTLEVAPSSVSKMVGQRRENLKKLHENGYCVKLVSSACLKRYEVRLCKKEVPGCF